MMLPNLPQALDVGLREIEKKGDRDNSILHVSDLAHTIPGEGCPRQLWLRLKNYEKQKLTAGKLLMFDHGKRIHERLVEVLRIGLGNNWGILEVEQPLMIDGVVGTCDVILIDYVTGETVIIDFKSQRGNAFRRKEGISVKPKPAHVIQVQGYIEGSREFDYPNKKIRPPKIGGIFYVDREGQNASIMWPVVRNSDAVNKAIVGVKKIARMVDAPFPIDPLLALGKETKTKGVPIKLALPWQCSYCDYMDVSCVGAIPKEYRIKDDPNNVTQYTIGHILNGTRFNPKPELDEPTYETVINLIRGN